jgi:hypothetical protein
MGEWKSAATLLTCCMHPDEHTMRAALANRRAVPAPPPARDVVTAVTADGLEIGAENVSARRAIDSTNRQQRAATR